MARPGPGREDALWEEARFGRDQSRYDGTGYYGDDLDERVARRPKGTRDDNGQS